MKQITLMSLLLFSRTAFAQQATLILDYSYGNQITGSTLQIDSDGAVSHTERMCCPPRTDVIPENPLSADELASLKQNIQVASENPVDATRGEPTSMGSSSGHLVTFLEGLDITIHTITRNPNPMGGGRDSVQKNHATEARREIEDLVNRYVRQQMYR